MIGNDGRSFEGKDVADQFVQHYENFLGTCDQVTPIQDPNSLFSRKLPLECADNMIRSFSEEDIKSAMFSVGDKKAPGPDGYTSRFFKSTWNIVGQDVCLAIKDFFDNGTLLKETDNTIISLVPKVPTPSKVNDFRPISCCNVLYKCISKLISDRIKVSLDHIVSENQSAFVPGRSISDNILLTQELMRGYHINRGAARCAFKVDIQKAYDTVDWQFLEAILGFFGFKEKMIKWIMVCVSTVSYSLNINGQTHGFFKGKRGLRQGDPMSPYLFTLVMKVLHLILIRKINEHDGFQYHTKCAAEKTVNLCFADDLILFCHGDPTSASIIMAALEEFKSCSGLVPSIPKSTVFFCNVKNYVKREILNILPFKEGVLPVKYLGVPLISTRLLHKDCKVLVERVKNRLNDWKNKSLSFVGRLQLIISVLSSMQVYWASVFILPKSITKEIEKAMSGFLWCQGEMERGKAKVAWKTLCLPKIHGGLGITSLAKWNLALMSTHPKYYD